MLIAANQESDDPTPAFTDDLTDLLQTTTEALKILIERDRQR